MTSWMAERDRLLAQANSLVKGLNPARPSVSPQSEKPHERPLTPQARPASSAPPKPAAVPAARSRSFTEGEADHQPLTFRRTLRSEAQPTETIPIPMLASNERDDIEIRVTRFREQQTRLTLEREAFYEKTRNALRSRLQQRSDD